MKQTQPNLAHLGQTDLANENFLVFLLNTHVQILNASTAMAIPCPHNSINCRPLGALH